MRNFAMLSISAAALWSVGASGVALCLCGVGCAKRNDQPAVQAAYPAPAAGVPVQQAPGNGDGSARPTPALATSPAALPAAAGLSQPGPLALPCSADAQCLTHRCNLAVGKCAWPCQTDNDCLPGMACIAPTCLPKLQ
ncbi:MAG: hypothetical protein ABJB12_01445 [Pseudomonadota bacterium]